MNNTHALLPCPFCGGTPDIALKPGSWGYTPDRVSVSCKTCGIGWGFVAEDQEAGKPPHSIEKEATQKAVDKWNRRA